MLPVVFSGGPGGYPGGLLGAEYLMQGLVPVDVFGLGSVVWDLYQAVATFIGMQARIDGNQADIVAEVEDSL